jgi:hypothetical protein
MGTAIIGTGSARADGCDHKSLFWNILRLTHLFPIFYENKNVPEAANPHKSNILGVSILSEIFRLGSLKIDLGLGCVE